MRRETENKTQEFDWKFSGFDRVVGAAGRFARARRFRQQGRFAEAIAETSCMLDLLRHPRVLRGGPAAFTLIVLGAHLMDELATAIGTPEMARNAMEEAVGLISDERGELT